MAQLPNRGPYDPMYENLPPLPDGMVHHQFPWDVKFTEDHQFYDSMGRSLVEQREVLTKNRPDEEQIEMIKQIFEETPASPNGEGREWAICLEAAMKGSAAVTRYLVREKGLKAANAPRRLGTLDMELFVACVNGFQDVVEVLIDEAEMDVNVEADQMTPLIRALQVGQAELVTWLLERGSDWKIDSQNVFTSAVASGKVDLAELMLAVAMSEQPDKPSSTWINGRLICTAAAVASEEMMQFVVENGNYPLAADATQEQRLLALDAMLFSLNHDETNPVCFQMALDRALAKDVETCTYPVTNNGKILETLRFSIGICCNRGKLDYLRRILELLFACTSVTENSDEFRKILRYCMRRCYDPISKACAIELLEKYNADPNVSEDNDEFYGTPLILGAVGRNTPEWTKFWLDRGADIHRAFGPYCDGPTALANSIRFREEGNARLLLEHGGPVDRMDDIKDLVGKKILQLEVSGATDETFLENGMVELTAIPNQDDQPSRTQSKPDVKVMILDLGDGVTEEWLKRIQLRKPTSDLANDGTRRPSRGQRG